jgi:hypothetical protein
VEVLAATPAADGEYDLGALAAVLGCGNQSLEGVGGTAIKGQAIGRAGEGECWE